MEIQLLLRLRGGMTKFYLPPSPFISRLIDTRQQRFQFTFNFLGVARHIVDGASAADTRQLASKYLIVRAISVPSKQRPR